MKIELKEIAIREVVNGYADNQENGVIGYGGKLNIRPPYQREFVYKDKQRDEVLNTIRKSFPLNVMYWVKNEDETYEVLDGQQRTISICEYVKGTFSINFQYFHNLTDDEQKQILDYKLMIYFCEGSDREKLDWFKTINIAGEKLTDQELRNAVYTGLWLSDAKRHFSKTNCPAYGAGSNYMNGSPIRQDYLETAIKWIAESNDETIEQYMAKNQHTPNATELWLYFSDVINWVRSRFPNYRKEMKGLEWGIFYNDCRNGKYDSNALEEKISELMQDEDVTKKSGIYEYVLSGNERVLSIRSFTDKQKREAYEKQKGICPKCEKHFEFNEMQGDHIIPWSKGGKTISDNCQMLCNQCNAKKSDK